MNSSLALVLAFGIGVVAGLRSLTAPAVVAWAAHLGWINLHGSAFSFMGSIWPVGIFTILAVVELVADQLPTTPSRTAPIGLSARIVTGALTGACLGVAGGATESPEHSAANRHALVWSVPCWFRISQSPSRRI